MLSNINIDRYSKFIQYFLSGIYILVFIRFLVLLIDYDTMAHNGFEFIFEYVRFIQIIIINITNPLMFPSNKLFILLFENVDMNIVNIISPIFVIIFILILKVIFRILTPYAKYYIKRFR